MIGAGQAEVIVTEALKKLEVVLDTVEPPTGISPGLVQHVNWIVRRLLAGCEVSERKR